MVSADGTFLVTRWPDEPEGGIEVKLRNINFQKHAEDRSMQCRKSLRETVLGRYPAKERLSATLITATHHGVGFKLQL